MKLESLNNGDGGNKSKSPPINNEVEEVIPTFNQGDTVMLKSKLQDYSRDLRGIAGLELEVDRCFTRDLGEGVTAEILYLKGDQVKNPYLAEHFKAVV